MTRLPDWRPRLEAVLRDARGRAFAYGAWDCALFAADCIAAMTGKDPAAELRGYDSFRAGLDRLRALGHAGHVSYAATLFPEISAEQLRAGDLAVLSGRTLAICQGRLIYAPSRQGLAIADRSTVTRAFRV
ncbi:DUF6950 family protein [Wenxinia saemankumensis]|uniref:DUF6950 domain-containing protein n=1 Tax=Wenxinia saemankumensis TaxID=1447782 RepID=A0A1M6F0G1_9RHOB|nr:hypothetical protein [Wenxinia saemankumensis]SHI91145.1 hypothetical protein SAMN05444417_2281 [Wenxinia saemankumensis]